MNKRGAVNKKRYGKMIGKSLILEKMCILFIDCSA